MPKLMILNPEFGPQSCELPDGKVTVGRNSRNMLVISDNSVSSDHAELLVEGNEVIVRELHSRNGTFVNGVRVQTQSGVLHGQTIRFGKVDLRLDLGEEADETSDASTVTAVFAMRDIKKQADRARPVAATFKVTFTPIGDAIPESMTMFIPKVQLHNAAPTKTKSRLVPIAIALAILVLVLALGRFFLIH
jgi:pSer/pThr/pTyr-binding forkhead associated (FHA) protein